LSENTAAKKPGLSEYMAVVTALQGWRSARAANLDFSALRENMETEPARLERFEALLKQEQDSIRGAVIKTLKENYLASRMYVNDVFSGNLKDFWRRNAFNFEFVLALQKWVKENMGPHFRIGGDAATSGFFITWEDVERRGPPSQPLAS
jgi:hypothetical protein